MADHWSDRKQETSRSFSRAAEPERSKPLGPDQGSDQVKKEQLGLHKGPPPPQPSRLAFGLARHEQAQDADRTRATVANASWKERQAELEAKKLRQRGDLTKSFHEKAR